MFVFLMKVISRQIYLYYFHISKLNELKVVDDLYFQYLTQTLSKLTSNTKLDRWEYRNKHNLNDWTMYAD
jgi:hypothetical protein